LLELLGGPKQAGKPLNCLDAPPGPLLGWAVAPQELQGETLHKHAAQASCSLQASLHSPHHRKGPLLRQCLEAAGLPLKASLALKVAHAAPLHNACASHNTLVAHCAGCLENKACRHWLECCHSPPLGKLHCLAAQPNHVSICHLSHPHHTSTFCQWTLLEQLEGEALPPNCRLCSHLVVQ